ncbi:MAG: A/G-specific adenine glycosylase [Rhodoferax sp.]|nr:A/G-specific adenine glycosylase [Rhodoferax sp.]
MAARTLADQVVTWQRVYGRHDLPWQGVRDPYRVWLSEIMLQQTQVVTVRDYFARFLERFPDLATLAAASLDDVLGLWSGLGYYSRARNLHRCAVQVCRDHGGEFPRSAEVLQTLPGIGPSTAAAIASLCFGERVAILDGNVKRVLCRFLGFDADLAVRANEQALWAHATTLLPTRQLGHSMPRYTQGLMDLGATVCTLRQPDCAACPLAATCVAKREGAPERFPVKTRKLKRGAQTIWLLYLSTAGRDVWLSQRPTPGVWAGLYCVPLFEDRASLQATLPEPWHHALVDGPVVRHVLTHKDLHLHPVALSVPDSGLQPTADGHWFTAQRWPSLGLPAPIRKLLQGG